MIVIYNAKRAKKDAADRSRLLERLMKKGKDGKIKLKELITNHGSKKDVEVKNETVVIHEGKIEDDTKWNGLHGVIANIQEDSAESILSRYRGLWQIEEAFRVSKHLKMRPIFHWTNKRTKAHITICFLAYTLVKQAVYRLKRQQKIEMSFEQIRNELLHVQSSLVVDTATKKRYMIPSHVTLNQKRIYQTFGLNRSEVPCAI